MPGQEVRTVEQAQHDPLRGPRHRLPVPEAHPPAAARRVPRVPGRPVLPPGRRRPAALVRRDAVPAARRAASPTKFLRPYNEKLYATDLDALDVDAMGRFFPHADIADIIANMRPGRRHASDGGYNATFTYPAGGAVQYIHALLRDLPAGHASRAASRSPRSISTRARSTTPRRRIRVRARASARRRCRALARMCGVAARPGGVHVEPGARVQPRLRPQGRARRPLDVLPRPRALVLSGRLVRQHPRRRSDEPLRRDRRARTTPRSTSTRCARACSPTSRASGIVDGPPARRAAPRRARSGVRPHHAAPRSPRRRACATRSRARGVHSVGRYGGWTYCSIEDNLIETRALAAALAP